MPTLPRPAPPQRCRPKNHQDRHPPRRAQPTPHPPAPLGPRTDRPADTIVVNDRTGTAYPVDPQPGPVDLAYPKIYDEALHCRAAVMDPRPTSIRPAAHGRASPPAPVDPADAPEQARRVVYRRHRPSPPPPRANRSSGQSPPAVAHGRGSGGLSLRRPRRPSRRHRPSRPHAWQHASRRPQVCLTKILKNACSLTPSNLTVCLAASPPRDDWPPTASRASIRTRNPPCRRRSTDLSPQPQPNPPPSQNRLIYG
jgi:hypothetical protein